MLSTYKHLFFLVVLFLLSNIAFAVEKRSQLEELIIWKMSDELKLTAQEEKKFTDIIRQINDKKSAVNVALKESLVKLKKAQGKEQEKELRLYRQILVDYNNLSLYEFDSLKPLLGVERMIKYVDLKQDLIERIKTMLMTPDSSTQKKNKLPEPKVIEEK